MRKDILHKPLFHLFFIIVLILIAYSNTFHSTFQFDDMPNIVHNPIIKELQFFTNPSHTKYFTDDVQYNAFKSRYIGYLTFALNYKIDQLNVTGYHIFNILIHIVNTFLVYCFIILSFRTPFLRKSALKDYFYLIGSLAAVLFAVHPIQTQAVTYIVQRFSSLATMFYLLSLVMYIKARHSKITESDVKAKKTLTSSVSKFIFYLISLSSAILAMKTKEIAFTLPVTIVLYDFMFFEGKIKERLFYIMPIFFTILIIPSNLMGAGKPIGDLINDVRETTRVYTIISRWDYLFTQFRAIVTYIRLLFLPANQNLDYEYHIYDSIVNYEVLLSLLLLLSILGLGVYLFYRYRQTVPHTRLIAFGIFWFFITLSVESGIIPIADVIFEHRMYLPSIGIFIAIGTFFFMVIEKLGDRRKSVKRAIVASLAIIIVLLTSATYARNAIWKYDLSLWKDVVNKSPGKARAYNNLGFAYKNQGRIDEAIEHYETAIKLKLTGADVHNNLGNAYASKGMIDKAIEQYKIAVKIKPEFSEAHNNLGNAYATKGMIDEAIKHYETALQIGPNIPEIRDNLNLLYKSKRTINKSTK